TAMQLRLRCGELAAHVLARPPGDILPVHRVVVGLALAGAGVLGRRTVGLTRLGNAVALVLARIRLDGLRRHGGGKAERKHAGDRGLQGSRILHAVSFTVWQAIVMTDGSSVWPLVVTGKRTLQAMPHPRQPGHRTPKYR